MDEKLVRQAMEAGIELRRQLTEVDKEKVNRLVYDYIRLMLTAAIPENVYKITC